MSAQERDRFVVEGVGCWCDGNTTLSQLRASGHSPECTQARIGWRRNFEHLSAIRKERAIAEEIGRQVLADARAVSGVER